MTAKPWVFTGPMVLAIMAGRKTMSRRIINHVGNRMHNGQLLCDWPLSGDPHYDEEKGAWLWELQTDVDDSAIFEIKPPFVPGEIRYVGEHLFNRDCFVAYKCDDLEFADPETHKAKVWPWKKSLLSNIFMPRWAARTYPKILRVWPERIQDISEEDARAEGCPQCIGLSMCGGGCESCPSDNPILWFRSLWNSIHGPDAWDLNPWVWAVEFERTEKPEED